MQSNESDGQFSRVGLDTTATEARMKQRLENLARIADQRLPPITRITLWAIGLDATDEQAAGLNRLAELRRTDERERCAKIAEDWDCHDPACECHGAQWHGTRIAGQIRRGE